MADEKLVFRRQFVLTTTGKVFPAWPKADVGRGLTVEVHPDLSLTQHRQTNCTLTLVGYAVDPEAPSLKDADILADLSTRSANILEFLQHAGRLAGRWVIVADTERFHLVMHDAAALRQVTYSDPSCNARFCCSQASTVARLFHLSVSAAADHGFTRTRYVQTDPEYWWPGDGGPYHGVRVLLPNHYLDLGTWTARRYWPQSRLPARSIPDAVAAGAALLCNMLSGVARRFAVALPLTAGWDSRAILAAACATGLRPYCYTLQFGRLSGSSPDILVPARLLRKLGLKHHVIRCPSMMDPSFKEIYRRNVEPAHDEAGAIAYGLSKEYPPGHVSLSGHCGEIARSGYSRLLEQANIHQDDSGDIDAEKLAEVCRMEPTRFVLEKFDEWLGDAKPASLTSGVPLRELFYWEQRDGRWAANGQAQWDLVHDRFTPFNCRPLIETLLSVDVQHRRAPGYALYAELIRHLAPEVLALPINPRDTAVAESIWKRTTRRVVRIWKAGFGSRGPGKRTQGT